MPPAFDDGVIIGKGRLDGSDVLIAAQEGRFMGGTFAEISGAKILGLLRGARTNVAGKGPETIILALDSGGVRLQEANAGEMAVSEIIRAIVEARMHGISVIALVGGRAGAFGGAGLIAATCSHIVISRHGRIGVSGPEVIETNKGVEEFDSRDKALVWRITGGRTRVLCGGADLYVCDDIAAFRATTIALQSAQRRKLTPDTLLREQKRLEQRLAENGSARDAPEIWKKRNIPDPEHIADLAEGDFITLHEKTGVHHDAR
ncbi:biotin-independent malonate decarboxylase subunit beta [Asaia prunellae]|uniref:biotin-independent malonate decarboxylase subunit beta n=1 Tax=Asaia prunellae TaxID=610245 RepID=UPI001FB0EA68|nr:biotin-independent malonate decarboxylase subunit beta [Asaia prunellae]